MKEKELRLIVRKILLESGDVISMDRFKKGRPGGIVLPEQDDIDSLYSVFTGARESLNKLEKLSSSALDIVKSYIPKVRSNLEDIIEICDMSKGGRNQLSDISLEAIKLLIDEAQLIEAGCDQICDRLDTINSLSSVNISGINKLISSKTKETDALIEELIENIKEINDTLSPS